MSSTLYPARTPGADGLLVEVHPDPDHALSDGAQSLTIPGFQQMMRELAPYIRLWRETRAALAAASAAPAAA